MILGLLGGESEHGDAPGRVIAGRAERKPTAESR
jgi:hypothetical protein